MASGTVLDPFRAELLKEFARRSSELMLVQSTDYMNDDGWFTSRKGMRHVLRSIKNYKPDFAFSLNRSGFNVEVLEELNCPTASWFIDNPSRFEANLRRYKKDEKIFCATKHQMDWMNSFLKTSNLEVEVQY